MCVLSAARAGSIDGAVEAGFREQRLVPLGVAPPGRGPAVEVRQLHAQNRRLQRIEPEVRADRRRDDISLLRRAAGSRATPRERARVGRRDQARRRRTHPDFSSERTRSIRPRRCRRPAGRDSGRRWPAPRLRRPARRHGRAKSRIGAMSALWPNRCTGMIAFVLGVMADAIAAAIDVERRAIDVDEHRARAEPAQWSRRVAKNEKGDVTTSSPGADAERHQRRKQRVGARRHTDGMRNARNARARAPAPRPRARG